MEPEEVLSFEKHKRRLAARLWWWNVCDAFKVWMLCVVIGLLHGTGILFTLDLITFFRFNITLRAWEKMLPSEY